MFFLRNDEIDKFERKYEITKKSFQENISNKKESYSHVHLPIKSQDNNVIMYFAKPKNFIISNIIRTFNKLSDSSIKDDCLKKLNETINALQKSMTFSQDLLMFSFHKPIKKNVINRTSIPTSVHLLSSPTSPHEKNFPSPKIHFKIKIKNFMILQFT